MLLKAFEKFRSLTALLFVLTGILLWAEAFMAASPAWFYPTENPAPLYAVLQGVLQQHPRTGFWMALAFLLLQSAYLNYILTSHGLMERYSFLTAIIYLLLMGAGPGMLYMHPVLIANFFLMLGLNQVLRTYNEEMVLIEVFNVGLLIALAGLFYVPALVFFLFLLFSLFIFYIIDLRSILAALLGLATPFFFLALYLFLTDRLPEGLQDPVLPLRLIGPSVTALPLLYKVFLAYAGLFGLLAFFRLVFSYIPDKPIRTRKRFWVIVYLMATALLSLGFNEPFREYHLGLVFLPLSAGLAAYLHQLRSRLPGELALLALVLLILAGKLSGW
jgi:hypothetical protein